MCLVSSQENKVNDQTTVTNTTVNMVLSKEKSSKLTNLPVFETIGGWRIADVVFESGTAGNKPALNVQRISLTLFFP